MKTSNSLLKQTFKSAIGLSTFIVIGVGILTLTFQLTEKEILKSEKIFKQKAFNEVIDPEEYDNDALEDIKIIPPNENFQHTVKIYRARKNNQPVALIVETLASDGYSGNIYLLIGVLQDGRISGIRVIKHKETPGLGDKIEVKKSNWILEFNGRSLREDNYNYWSVKKDGGMFDQFSGATITPRAIVKSVRNTLNFINQQGHRLYE